MAGRGRPKKIRGVEPFEGEKKFVAGVKPGRLEPLEPGGEPVLKGQPFSARAFGGVAFQRLTQRLVPVQGTGGSELGLDGGQDGGEVMLSYDDFERIVRNVLDFRVRWNATKTRAMVFSVKRQRHRWEGEKTVPAGPAMREQDTDEPLAQYLYLVPYDALQDFGGRDAEQLPTIQDMQEQTVEAASA